MKNKDLLVLFLNHLDKMDLLPFNRLYNYDSFSQEFLDSNEAKINYTHSCTQLKDKDIPTFMFWMDCNSIRMVEHNRFIKENNIMSFQEVSQKYINEMINL